MKVLIGKRLDTVVLTRYHCSHQVSWVSSVDGHPSSSSDRSQPPSHRNRTRHQLRAGGRGVGRIGWGQWWRDEMEEKELKVTDGRSVETKKKLLKVTEGSGRELKRKRSY